MAPEFCVLHGQALTCPTCDVRLPEYKESIDLVAARFGIAPKSFAAMLGQELRRFLNHPPLYRWYTNTRRRRVLTASEIKRLDAHYFRTHFKYPPRTVPTTEPSQ